ncbi:MAG TPA: N-formylglutamate amidohydrolase [Allosphingosinicella sp.]
MAESPAEPPFTRIGPENPASPVVLSVPHAGRAYSDALLRASRLPRSKLEALEDRLVDRLVWRAVAAGAPALIASVPRAEIDLNRDEREIDAAMVAPPPPARTLMASPRTRGGLGLVPSRISGAGSIWLQRLPEAELAQRIETIHRPYHAALADMLEQARRSFGVAILLDCHSMPPRSGGDAGGAAIVFGDRYGTSIRPDLLHAALAAAERSGFTTACNAPYAGGFITTRHGRPAAGIHALQIEIDRSLYLDRELREPGPGFDAASHLVAAVVAAVGARALDTRQAIAAE